MAVQTIATGRPGCRPTPTYRVALTARAHGLLDALHGRSAIPARFGRAAGRYYAAYLAALSR